MPLGFEVGGFIGSFQADEFGQGGRVTHLQTQRGIRRIMARLLLARLVVVIPLHREAAKNALHLQRDPLFADLTGLGLVLGIGLVGGLLEQPADQRVGGFENRRAHQLFQLGDGVPL